ncbi:MAG: tail fiber domain-containing protein, partial [Bacteroidota bacterium]
RNTLLSNTTGMDNTAMGSYSLASNTTGINSAFGYYSLYSNTTGSNNAAFGFGSLRTNTTGTSNCAFGEGTLYNNTNGYANTASGYSALYTNTTGYENTASGSNALGANTTGFLNVAVGANALSINLPVSTTTGNKNTAIGYAALNWNATGTTNTALGYNSGFWFNGGTNNTFLGALTSMSNGNNNSTAIGNGASANASNKIRLGDVNVTVIEGQVAYTYPSDARFKYNVKNNIPGLDFIMQLKPVTYNFDTRKFEEHLIQDMPDSSREERMKGRDFTASSDIIHSGFLAQDIEKACKQLNYNFDGLHIPDGNNKTDNYSVAYSQFIMPLVKGMQEQQTTITQQNEKINQQEKIICNLVSRIEKLESSNK